MIKHYGEAKKRAEARKRFLKQHPNADYMRAERDQDLTNLADETAKVHEFLFGGSKLSRLHEVNIVARGSR